MRRARRGRALRRRYGRQAGSRHVDEMLEAQDRPTVQAPRLKMREQILWDKKLREIREAEQERR